jgi:thioredoxin reductase
MHMVLTWNREDAAKFRNAARENILYDYITISLENVEITHIEKVEENSSLFKATDSNGGDWYGRKALLATGIQDIMLDIKGYKANFAKSM